MTGLYTNVTEYRNDIAEEMRLFLGVEEIAFAETACDACEPLLCVTLDSDQDGYLARASCANVEETLRFSIARNADALTTKKLRKRYIKLACYRLLKRLYPRVETPWGSLTGIRPTKLFRELSQDGGADRASALFCDPFDVSAEKTLLARAICDVQEPYIRRVRLQDADVYIGIPFCKTRCLYCSFASETLKDASLLATYLDALRIDIARGAQTAREAGLHIRAMYIGGGTPTVLNAEQLEALIDHALSCYGSVEEFTVEAGRPDTIDREKLLVLKRYGVARISINPQTMCDETLRAVGRAHTAAQTVETFLLARSLGFDNVNMDLIAGLPNENAAIFTDTCERIAALRPDNLTVHALAIKRSSRLKRDLDAYSLPDATEAARMIAIGRETAEHMGMRAYYLYRQKYMSGNLENVGYALPSYECAYNIDMMEETVSILSHGAGTMTKRVFYGENRIERMPSPKDVPTYLHKLDLLTAERDRFFRE